MRDKSLRSGERQYGDSLDKLEAWHRWRYQEACKYIKPTDIVLDLGCGVGYGSYIMSPLAKNVFGYDDSEEAIDFAFNHYKRDNIFYSTRSVLDIAITESVVKAMPPIVVAFEIIEHIEDTDAVFNIFKRLNAKLIILSTPHLDCPIGGNQFHYKHYGMDELIYSFRNIGYKPKRAELVYFGNGLCNFMVMERR